MGPVLRDALHPDRLESRPSLRCVWNVVGKRRCLWQRPSAPPGGPSGPSPESGRFTNPNANGLLLPVVRQAAEAETSRLRQGDWPTQ